MKIFLLTTLILLFFVVSCSEILDFEFIDNSGRSYRTTTLLTQLEQRYNYQFKNLSIVLMETPSLKDQKYLKQNAILDSMNHAEAENLQLMYITSCWNEEYKHGYHTSIKTAKRLVKTNNSFRIIIMDVNGKIFFKSNEPISVETLRQLIKEKKK